jgi:hypothetical protein
MRSPLAAETLRSRGTIHPDVFPLAVLAAGLLVRLGLAYFTFLNPDEALHYLLSVQPSAALAYQASLTTVHPPLFILWLHYWGGLGHSEVFLRLPCVLAGTAFCWITFRWLQSVVNRCAGVIALVLLSFLPPMVFLSAELRQYAFLFFFMSASVYLFDRALEKNSALMVFASALFLCLALLTHYSAFMFALAFGVYAILRVLFGHGPRGVHTAWITGQLLALGVIAFLFKTHISHLASRGVPQGLAEGWFHSAVFQPREENIFWFTLRAGLRFFHYLCWSGAIGAVALALFIAGIALLVRTGKPPHDSAKPTARALGIFLFLPFLINLAAAFAGKYPFGGTRHNSFLALFAVAGMSIPLARWKAAHRWLVPSGIAIALAVATFFPSPSGTYMRPKFQRRNLMDQATRFLARSSPPGSTILTDQEGALLLSYYFCHDNVVQIDPSPQPLHKFRCGDGWVISPFPRWFIFDGHSLPAALAEVAKTESLSPDLKVLFFQAGWMVEKEPDMRRELAQHGCADPRTFGENILVCELTVSALEQIAK